MIFWTVCTECPRKYLENFFSTEVNIHKMVALPVITGIGSCLFRIEHNLCRVYFQLEHITNEISNHNFKKKPKFIGNKH